MHPIPSFIYLLTKIFANKHRETFIHVMGFVDFRTINI